MYHIAFINDARYDWYYTVVKKLTVETILLFMHKCQKAMSITNFENLKARLTNTDHIDPNQLESHILEVCYEWADINGHGIRFDRILFGDVKKIHT